MRRKTVFQVSHPGLEEDFGFTGDLGDIISFRN